MHEGTTLWLVPAFTYIFSFYPKEKRVVLFGVESHPPENYTLFSVIIEEIIALARVYNKVTPCARQGVSRYLTMISTCRLL